MNRRQVLAFLAAAGFAACSPGMARADTADELAAAAQAELTGGNTAKALGMLLEAEGKDPRNDRVQALLGRTYFQQGDARAALSHFTLAVRINPEDTLSRMLAETISQFPLPPAKSGPARETGSGRPRPSALARQAQTERENLLAGGPRVARQGPPRLLIDAGHGGSDAGSVGDGLREADVTLDLALRLARLLAAAGDELTILLTRTADVTLPGWARAALAGFYGADLLISLHAARLPDPGAAGIVVFGLERQPSDALAALASRVENGCYGPGNSWTQRGGEGVFVAAVRDAAGHGRPERGRQLATALARAIPAASPLPVRPAAAGPFRLLAAADRPALLVETGFLSNPDDAAALANADRRQQLAGSLAEAVLTVARAL
ncbi:N-acetylmuramoyl-L-alanine amidase [Solidesulfovibrio sp.]